MIEKLDISKMHCADADFGLADKLNEVIDRLNTLTADTEGGEEPLTEGQAEYRRRHYHDKPDELNFLKTVPSLDFCHKCSYLYGYCKCDKPTDTEGGNRRQMVCKNTDCGSCDKCIAFRIQNGFTVSYTKPANQWF